MAIRSASRTAATFASLAPFAAFASIAAFACAAVVGCRDRPRASGPAPSAAAPASSAPARLPEGWETPDHDVAWLARAEACPGDDARCARTRAEVLFHAVRSFADANAEARSRPEHAALLARYVELARVALASRDDLELRTALAFVASVAPGSPSAAKRLRAESVTQVRAALAEDRPREVRDRALLAAGALRDVASRPALVAAAGGADVGLARRAVASLALLGNDPADAAAIVATLPRFRDDPGALGPLLPAYVNALSTLGRIAEAVPLVDVVLAADRDDGAAWALRAFALTALGRRAEAGDAVRRAIDLGNAGALVRALDPALVADARAHAPSVEARRREVRERLAARGKPAAPTRWSLTRANLGRAKIASAPPEALERRAAEVSGDEATRALGAELFATYTFRSEESYDACLQRFLGGSDADLLDALGLQVDAGGTVVGVVRTERPGDPPRYGVTCSVCHGGVDASGVARAGMPTRYDQGLFLAACSDQPLYLKSGTQSVGQLLRYGPGRNDSSTDQVADPTDIPHLFHLGAYETLRWNGDVVGIENQATHNLAPGDAPWPVLRAIAAYLADVPLPPAPASSDPPALVAQGREVFERSCSTCHAGPARTSGRVVPVSLLGTDPTRVRALLANSNDGYKVPSLARVSLTPPYLHDGSVASLEQLLDARRLAPEVRSHLAPLGVVRGSLGGHRFGLDRSAAERRALLAYLRTL